MNEIKIAILSLFRGVRSFFRGIWLLFKWIVKLIVELLIINS
jgi:hypothetical protein